MFTHSAVLPGNLHSVFSVYPEIWLEEAMERPRVWTVWELKQDSKQLMKLEIFMNFK